MDKTHRLPFRRATACLVDDVQSAVKRGNENAPPGVLANVIYVVATDGILVSIVMHIVTLRAIGHEHIESVALRACPQAVLAVAEE